MKILTINLTALIFLFILCPYCPASTANSGADFLVKVGERALAKGDAQTAIHEFSKALMLNPNHSLAKMHLEKFNLQEGLYTGTQTRETQTAALARDVATYKDRVDTLKDERHHLQKRIIMLEDAIERKGDHKLLKDIEDYYRHSAFYDVDATLPADKQLAALNTKHRDFLEYAFDKDRIQERYLDVMEELLGYREVHLENTRNDAVRYQVALAENRKELLWRMQQLKALTQEFDEHRQKGFYERKEIEYLQDDLAEANYQVNMLLDNRRILIIQLEQHLDNMKEAL